MAKLSDTEIAAIAAKVVADLRAQKELDAIELHRQVSRLEDDLRKAQAEIARLAENNGYLQNFNNQLLASRNGQSSYVPPVASAPVPPAL